MKTTTDGQTIGLTDAHLIGFSTLTRGNDVSAPEQHQGRYQAGIEPRIVGGQQASIEQLPWQVAITFNPATNPGSAFDRYTCGGTLVAPKIVITAAHCMYDAENDGFQHPSEFAVVSGRTHLSSQEGRESPIATYYLPTDDAGDPLYRQFGAIAHWDVAIIELPTEAIGSPIKLAGADETSLWAAGRPAIISGWGATRKDGSGYPDALQAAQTTIFRDPTCSRSYPRWPTKFRSLDMFCSSGLARDVCFGDSGGPIVVPTPDGQARLIGATSWGDTPWDPDGGCGNYAGVYARLASDPMRSTLRDGVQQIAGVDIVGSGARAQHGAGFSKAEALQNSLAYAWQQCRKDRNCRAFNEGRCKASGGGYKCKALKFQRYRGRRFTCSRKIVWLPVGGGGVNGRTRGGWKCRRGW